MSALTSLSAVNDSDRGEDFGTILYIYLLSGIERTLDWKVFDLGVERSGTFIIPRVKKSAVAGVTASVGQY